MTRATPTQLGAALETVAAHTRITATRIDQLTRSLTDCAGPLRANDPTRGGTHHGINDPTGEHVANGSHDEATTDRQRLERLTARLLADATELAGITAKWLPDTRTQHAHRGGPRVTNADLWCPNHRRHNMNEPRDGRRRHCRLCDELNREHGALPDRTLLEAAARHRLSSADIDRWLDRTKTTTRKATTR